MMVLVVCVCFVSLTTCLAYDLVDVPVAPSGRIDIPVRESPIHDVARRLVEGYNKSRSRGTNTALSAVEVSQAQARKDLNTGATSVALIFSPRTWGELTRSAFVGGWSHQVVGWYNGTVVRLVWSHLEAPTGQPLAAWMRSGEAQKIVSAWPERFFVWTAPAAEVPLRGLPLDKQL